MQPGESVTILDASGGVLCLRARCLQGVVSLGACGRRGELRTHDFSRCVQKNVGAEVEGLDAYGMVAGVAGWSSRDQNSARNLWIRGVETGKCRPR